MTCNEMAKNCKVIYFSLSEEELFPSHPEVFAHLLQLFTDLNHHNSDQHEPGIAAAAGFRHRHVIQPEAAKNRHPRPKRIPQRRGRTVIAPTRSLINSPTFHHISPSTPSLSYHADKADKIARSWPTLGKQKIRKQRPLYFFFCILQMRGTRTEKLLKRQAQLKSTYSVQRLFDFWRGHYFSHTRSRIEITLYRLRLHYVFVLVMLVDRGGGGGGNRGKRFKVATFLAAFVYIFVVSCSSILLSRLSWKPG